MKVFVAILLVSFVAACTAEFENLRSVEETPGFWDGRDPALKAAYMASKVTRGSRITNGQVATPGQFPHMGFLSISTLVLTFMCGSSIIGPTTVLTAAHCVDSTFLSNVLIILGAHNRNIVEPTQLRINVAPANVIRHPSYNSQTLMNDVAVMRVPAVTYTARIQPIRLPQGAELQELFGGVASQLAGWGETETGATSATLRFINHNVITNAACQVQWGTTVQPSHVCSSTIEGRSGCGGDSGGPLTVIRGGAPTVVGIVSFGTANCMQGWPSVYARYTSFHSWVITHM